jgi:hypothetical protein
MPHLAVQGNPTRTDTRSSRPTPTLKNEDQPSQTNQKQTGLGVAPNPLRGSKGPCHDDTIECEPASGKGHFGWAKEGPGWPAIPIPCGPVKVILMSNEFVECMEGTKPYSH